MIDYPEGMNTVSREKWMPVLVRKTKQIRKDQEHKFSKINKISLCDPEELARHYVEPDCQDIIPADNRAEDEMVAKQPILEKIDQFFKQPTHHKKNNQLFIQAHAGMGKSALLAMLKLMHWSGFWPQYSVCELKKLGKGTLKQIKQLDLKPNTILLLDALDEDPKAHGRVMTRLLDILESTKIYSKVIITCRTRFFQDVEKHAKVTAGRICIGPFHCYSKYISFFNNQKVYQYLSKRFPNRFLGLGFNQKKRDDARSIIVKMGSLHCRPMLLNCTDDLIGATSTPEGDSSEYRLFNGLFDSWLKRICTNKKEIATSDLHDGCINLAVWMQIHKKSQISRDEIDGLIEKVPTLKTITQMDWMSNGSLLKRNSDGDYRFLHKSVQEFCVAKFLSEKPAINIEGTICVNEKICQLIMQSGTINPDLDPGSLDLIQFDYAEKKKKSVKRFGIEFTYIPPGLFKLGSPEHESGRESYESQHFVVLPEGFYMQCTPLTQAQWKSVMKGQNPSLHKGDGDRPVEQVSWHDVQVFINKLNYYEGREIFALPTEAQWEYACRAGTTTPYYTGNTTADLERAGWYRENSNGQTHPVALKEPNKFGLYDMHGNVLEWVEDHWHDDYRDVPLDGSAWLDEIENEFRIVRGGCWTFAAAECRSAFRGGYKALNRSGFVGFRLVTNTDQWKAIKKK
jgi:formylglycine-generating enzyme required for sulfatase activity